MTRTITLRGRIEVKAVSEEAARDRICEAIRNGDLGTLECKGPTGEALRIAGATIGPRSYRLDDDSIRVDDVIAQPGAERVVREAEDVDEANRLNEQFRDGTIDDEGGDDAAGD